MTSPENILINVKGRQLPLIPTVAITLPTFLLTFGFLLGAVCQAGAL
ncbi:hypothetical protein SEA_FRANKIE_30 [Mycobacterium phage Frankie]|nr:hypothetical protein SEA_FRANKIE_30 [Mycobacterium phage Frankie]